MDKQVERRGIVLLCTMLALTAPAQAVEAVTVAVWGSSPAEVAAFDQAAAAFTRSTGIAVRKQVIEDKYQDVLKSRFAASNPPDVFYLDASEAPVLIESDVLEPLELSPADLADFYPQFLQAFRGRDGKLYGLPKDYSTLALYLNPRLLKQAGYYPDDVPRDFNGLMRFARTLQARLPRGVAAMIVEKDLARHLAALETSSQPLIGADGHAHFIGNAAAYAYLNQLVSGHLLKYLYSPKDDLGADWPGAAFGTQRTVMMMEGNWVQPALKNDYGDVPFVTREMPTVNQRKQTMAFVVGYAVPRGARNKAAGLRFARYMTGPGQRLWASASGTLPTRRSVEAAMQVRTVPALAAHVEGASYATVWSRGIELPILNTNFGNQFLAAFNGSKSLQQALEKAETVSNREIERQR
ncbi:extracellular solute-binding protein [Undibacterium sp. TS12]|uniref:extracellular solute-binding protein n=1 Tax=Undibacterium sp. TS12 TaxID=2908202 RepID=UPI001F4CA66D|nr:extracellular solute-binding protein [Undibacterium sp. TS12]MCH8621454.1 extracellular solute-binding protein [Undibacterium sp. TS12]